MQGVSCLLVIRSLSSDPTYIALGLYAVNTCTLIYQFRLMLFSFGKALVNDAKGGWVQHSQNASKIQVSCLSLNQSQLLSLPTFSVVNLYSLLPKPSLKLLLELSDCSKEKFTRLSPNCSFAARRFRLLKIFNVRIYCFDGNKFT